MSEPLSKRRPVRSRLYLNASIRVGRVSEPARIRDISASGALIEASAAPEVGDAVEVTCQGATAEGRVAWVDSTWFGVEFKDPSHSGFLSDLSSKKLKVSAPRGYRRETLEDLAGATSPGMAEAPSPSPAAFRTGCT